MQDLRRRAERAAGPAAFAHDHRDGQTEDAFIAEFLGKAIGVNTDRWPVLNWSAQLVAMQKEAAGIDQAATPGQAGAIGERTNLDFNTKNFGITFTGLFQAVGHPMVEPAIWVIHQLTDSVTWLAQKAVAHSNAVKSPTTIHAATAAIEAEPGGLDMLVSNAGTTGRADGPSGTASIDAMCRKSW